MGAAGKERDLPECLVGLTRKTAHNKKLVAQALAITASYSDEMNQSYPDYESKEPKGQSHCNYCLDEGSCHVVHSKTKLMNDLIDTGNPEKVTNIFTHLVEEGHRPCLATYTTVLAAMTMQKSFQDLQTIISTVKEKGMEFDLVFYEAVINAFSESGDMVSAELYLQKMKASGFKPTTSTFTTLIKGYGIAGKPEESLKLLEQMSQYGMPKPNLKTYNVLIRAFCNNKLISEAHKVINHMVSSGLKPDVVTYNTIATGLARNGETQMAELMIADMNQNNIRPNKRTCCIIVSGYIREGKMKEALRFMHSLKDLDVYPNLVTFNSCIKGFMHNTDKDGVDQVLTLMRRFGIRPDVITFSTIMNGWIEAGLIHECREAFDNMLEAGIKPDMHVYSILTKGNVRSHEPEKAEELLKDMMESGLQPNVVIFTTVINGWCRVGNMERAISIFEKMCENGIKPNRRTFETLMRGYGKAKQPKKAEEMLHMMEELNISTTKTAFHVIADAWRAAGQPKEAYRVLRSMNLKKFSRQDEMTNKDPRIAKLEKIYRKQPPTDPKSSRLQPPNAILTDHNVSGYSTTRSRMMLGGNVISFDSSRTTTKSTFSSHPCKFGARLSVTCNKHCLPLHSVAHSYAPAFLN
ncbi:unnamed protein product [Rhodiola kirilowii]